MPPKPPDNVVKFRRPGGSSFPLPRFLPPWLFRSVTGWLIVANVAIWLGMVVVTLGGGILTPFPGGLTLALGEMVPELVLTQPWRLVCAMFLHANLMHIGFNMLFLWYFGLRLEDALGKGRYLALYLLAGLGGEIGSYAWHFFSPGNSVGASGAILGVMGGLAGLTWQGLGRNHPVTKMYLQYALVGFAIGIVENLLGVAALDNAAHIAGWLCGLGLGHLFAGKKAWPPATTRAVLAASALGVVACFAASIV
ncbi:MAG TPA: rhomboid family intramembrane serine protease, partial [bacterium]|nr:rhomboid family intramembrane serine protease [bacterium]